MHQLGQVLEMVYSPSGQGDCRGYMGRVGVFYIDGGNLLHRVDSLVDGDLVLECVSALGAGVGRVLVVGFGGFAAVFKEFPHILQVFGGEFVEHLSAIGASLSVFGAF